MPLKQYDSKGNYVDTIYTQAELDQAVQDERDKNIKIFESVRSKYTYLFEGVVDECIKALKDGE